MSDVALPMQPAARERPARHRADWSAVWGGTFIFAAIWTVFEIFGSSHLWHRTFGVGYRSLDDCAFDHCHVGRRHGDCATGRLLNPTRWHCSWADDVWSHSHGGYCRDASIRHRAGQCRRSRRSVERYSSRDGVDRISIALLGLAGRHGGSFDGNRTQERTGERYRSHAPGSLVNRGT